MYQINAIHNGTAYRIYSPDRVDDDNCYVDVPVLTSEINCASVLEFDLPPDSKGYNLINTLKTTIKVYDSVDGSSTNRSRLFKGRALYIDTLMSGVKHVYCEGELAYLQDSVVMAYQYEGTVANLFRKFINDHNSQMPADKEFVVGRITIEDKDEVVKCESTTYPTTLEEIQKQLLDEFGGYIMPRCEIENGEEVTYLDYLEDASVENSQTIEFGENLVDISERSTAEEVFTVLIPLGAVKRRQEGEVEKRINISSVNGGSKELQDAEGIAEFGKIYKVMIWNKVKDPAKLKSKGQKALARGSNDYTEIELSAVDMHLLEVNTSAIRLGEKNRIVSLPHGFDKWMPCKKIVIDMESPERSIYNFGRTGKSLTGINQNTNMKVDAVSYDVDDLDAEVESISLSYEDLDRLKAPLNSPNFTGLPTAPTAEAGTSNTQIATTKFVSDAISDANSKTQVTVTAASGVVIDVNKSYKQGNVLYLNVKGHATAAKSNASLFTFTGANVNPSGFTFGIPTGDAWGINGMAYGYINSNGVVGTIASGKYFHITQAFICS